MSSRRQERVDTNDEQPMSNHHPRAPHSESTKSRNTPAPWFTATAGRNLGPRNTSGHWPTTGSSGPWEESEHAATTRRWSRSSPCCRTTSWTPAAGRPATSYDSRSSPGSNAPSPADGDDARSASSTRSSLRPVHPGRGNRRSLRITSQRNLQQPVYRLQPGRRAHRPPLLLRILRPLRSALRLRPRFVRVTRAQIRTTARNR